MVIACLVKVRAQPAETVLIQFCKDNKIECCFVYKLTKNMHLQAVIVSVLKRKEVQCCDF